MTRERRERLRVRPVFIPLRLEYVRFLIKVAQTTHLSKAIHEPATSSGEEAFSVQISD